MLRALRLQNYRSFADSGRIELADLNVFIGPNSAGKTNVLAAIQLALESMLPDDRISPLALSSIPAFQSFSSVRRTPSNLQELHLGYEWVHADSAPICEFGIVAHSAWYTLRENPINHSSAIASVELTLFPPKGSPLRLTQKRGHPEGFFKSSFSPPTSAGARHIHREVTKFDKRIHEVLAVLSPPRGATVELSVVRPNRPVPRSVYVLDDPGISSDDRELLVELIHMWGEGKEQSQAREHLIENLDRLGLARNIRITKQRIKGAGPQLVEVQIAPRKKSQSSSIADVGFGVSQVLPLLTRDAQLENGGLLIAYQPEVHLHPRAQSRLADVFVASVERGNRVYVETHSEHLVLRLQTLVAKGLISPDRVRVFCVEHDGTQSNVRPMSFDEAGIPQQRWPHGFLDTGLELARELAAARQQPRPATPPKSGTKAHAKKPTVKKVSAKKVPANKTPSKARTRS